MATDPVDELADVLAGEIAAGHGDGARSVAQVRLDALALLDVATCVNAWEVRAVNGEGHKVPDPDRGYRWAWDASDENRFAAARAAAAVHVGPIAARYGAVALLGGDPRGFTMWLILASGRSNSHGIGWGL